MDDCLLCGGSSETVSWTLFLKQQQSVKNVGYALKNGRRSQKRH